MPGTCLTLGSSCGCWEVGPDEEGVYQGGAVVGVETAVVADDGDGGVGVALAEGEVVSGVAELAVGVGFAAERAGRVVVGGFEVDGG